MSLIEGIGDEVTFLVAVILIVAVLAIAWMSTRVNSMPYTSIVIIDRVRFIELLRRLRAASSALASNVTQGSTPANASATEVSSEASQPSGEGTEAASISTPVAAASGSDNHAPVEGQAPVPVGSSVSLNTVGSASASNVSSNTSSDASLSEQPASNPEDISATDKVQIRLQHIDGRQQTVLASPDDTIGHLKRCHFATELAANSIVRFVASGKELRDESSTLRSLQLGRTGAVIHCLVTPQRTSQSQASSAESPAGHQFDIGVLVFPLFGTVLGALWYARVAYRGYFNGTSTFSLFAVSFLYMIALFASFRGTGQQQPQHAHAD